VEYRYHVAPDGLRVGDVLQCGEDAPIRPGSCIPLRHIPLGVHIHNIELVGADTQH
jgi:large subunit ribosomal protein L2